MPSNFLQRRKFVLDSTDNWYVSAVVATGDIEVYVGLNPDTVETGGHLWSGAATAGEEVRVNVKQTDANFHMNTWYYVYITSTSNVDAIIKLKLHQERTVNFIGNNHDYTYSLRHPHFVENAIL